MTRSRRRRSRRSGALLLVVAALAAGWLVAGRDPGGAGGEGRWDRVERVVDGDTVVLARAGKARLIGVDTPEVYGGVECYGREASGFAKRVLPGGERVRYEVGVEERDRYGRKLVYVWLEDGRFVNAMLVREGYARPLTIPPNVEHADEFARLADDARERARGLWAPGACGA